MTKSEYESEILLLIGRRIADVRYHELVYRDPAEHHLLNLRGTRMRRSTRSIMASISNLMTARCAMSPGEPSFNLTASVSDGPRHNTWNRSESGK